MQLQPFSFVFFFIVSHTLCDSTHIALSLLRSRVWADALSQPLISSLASKKKSPIQIKNFFSTQPGAGVRHGICHHIPVTSGEKQDCCHPRRLKINPGVLLPLSLLSPAFVWIICLTG